ncbi:MAG: PaaI family thioesterase [Micromonosporaceae bacterium]
MNAPESWGEPRQKTITWYDPIRSAQAGAAMSGRDYLQAMIDEKLPPPPIAGLFGMRAVSVGDGDVVFTCTPDEAAYNPIGLVHGGLVCTLLDSVAGCAVQATLPAGVGYTSAEIKVNYLRPIHADTGELTARGWLAKPGRRIAFAEADVRDAAGKVYATATSTCLVLST